MTHQDQPRDDRGRFLERAADVARRRAKGRERSKGAQVVGLV